MDPQAPKGIKPPIVENIPEQLAERPQWVCWQLVKREGGKATKKPYIPGTQQGASSTDLMTWRSLEEALAAYEAADPPYDGIGFCFCSADPFVGIDLDNCRDPETGRIERWAQTIIDGISEGYVEASPSGTGVHLIACGILKEGVNTKSVEVYGQDRFFTVTGAEL